MQKSAPLALLVSTVACVIVLNVVLAQLITQTFYPGAGLHLGPAVLGALILVVLVSVAYVVVGWRGYLRRRPDA